MNTTACKRRFSLGCVLHTDGAAFQPWDGGFRTEGGSGPPWSTPRYARRLVELLDRKPAVVPGSVRVEEALHSQPPRPHPGRSVSCEHQQIINRMQLSFVVAADGQRSAQRLFRPR